ncbi:CAP domain-containing protein [Solirubrobacter sp. CPCC 204708]|uniref:CAP domain-containing protein n=1 Tax=Solirubrobacter deserti TaxID=2282478 RepID=A0ABT4RJ25_9ACTN|nr:CAP domain-containing protein [Solirubrobacter deserti]MBE2320319.1 CAP domain-containing protein [Solirubrobacter deserti]MDA0138295.1 CAP domain-containing protein [Solirubrobacter deserti]
MIPAVAVAAGLVFAAPASAAPAKKGSKATKTITAKIALGDKRSTKAKAKATKAKKVQAKASLAPCSNTTITPDAANLEVVRAAILCLHNQIRNTAGLPLLKDNAKLRKAAAGHSDDMVADGFFDHTSPDGDTFVDRILAAGYAKRNDAWTIGENLAWGTGELSTPQAIMDAWMNSAGHKANILKKSYKEVGIAIRLGVPSDAGVGATVTADFGAKA